MLYGSFTYSMDRKGRVVMPGRFRSVLGSPFVLTRAPGQSLLAVSASQWRAMVERHANSILFTGFYLAAAVECRLDGTTGRFLVPHTLRDYCELHPADEVVIVGIGRAVQIWKRSRWQEASERGEFSTLDRLVEDLDLPHPVETEPFRHRLGRPLGVLLVECRGRFDAGAIPALAETIAGVLAERPSALILDVRETGETATGVQLLLALLRRRLDESGTRLLLVAADPELASDGISLFPDLDSVLWRLASERVPTSTP